MRPGHRVLPGQDGADPFHGGGVRVDELFGEALER
jgi:hypothetical protein